MPRKLQTLCSCGRTAQTIVKNTGEAVKKEKIKIDFHGKLRYNLYG